MTPEIAAAALVEARTALLLDQPFFGQLVSRLTVIIDPEKETAETDGSSIWFNPDFLATLTPPTIKTLYAHEAMHVALLHHTRRHGREARRWNVAADYVINLELLNCGFAPMADWLLDRQYAGMSTEQVYALLPETLPKPAPGGVVDAPTPLTAEPEARVFINQAVKAARLAGRLPGELERLVGEALRPRADAGALFRRFAQQNAASDYSFARPNPRFQHLILPSLRTEAMGDMVVVIDSSGSITHDDLGAFSGWLRAIHEDMQPSLLWVIHADAAVKHVDRFEPNDQITLSLRGGGGTDFKPAFKWVVDNDIAPACLAYFTDAKGAFPLHEPDFPVLWMVKGHAATPWGEHVRID